VPPGGRVFVAVDRRTVEHVARLARLSFNDEELEAFADEMNKILAFFSELGEVDTGGVEAAFRALRRSNVLRSDEPAPMLGTEAALANAPDRSSDSFRVPTYLPEDPH
jgi:aspartyl-tRNA(Asn)/glutamyl-tRNA(Gln) amidotransferase subunit C